MTSTQKLSRLGVEAPPFPPHRENRVKSGHNQDPPLKSGTTTNILDDYVPDDFTRKRLFLNKNF